LFTKLEDEEIAAFREEFGGKTKIFPLQLKVGVVKEVLDHPEAAIQLLSQLRNDESEYVRKSVGNALCDISKKHKDLVKNELCTWDTTNKQIKQTHKLASKFLQKMKC